MVTPTASDSSIRYKCLRELFAVAFYFCSNEASAFCKANECQVEIPYPSPTHTPAPFQSTELQSVAMADPSSQTISDKLHHAFAYFLQFVFVRTKRIETNAISAQKTHKKRREKAEQKSSKTRESTRRIKIKPNKGVHPCLPLPHPVGLALCIQITLPHCSHSFRSSYSPHHATCQSQLPKLQLQLQLQLQLELPLSLSLPLSLCPSARCLFTLFAICCACPPPPYMP